ncbi:MAG TPA: dihydropteroate synthase, partial [Caldilinea sp.]|nr:dihydropteroate synthase [Caldilinea sp.]
MYIIGENIHIISPRVKEALAERDGAFFTDLARRQVAAGAQALDLNIGPRKKDGPEVMEWLLDCVCPGADGAAFSLDTTNLAAIEAGLKKLERGRAIINSTSAEPERLEKVPLVAAQYGAKLVALTMGSGMIPVKADERVEIAL